MRQRIFTLRQIIEAGTEELKEAGIEEAALDAWYLLEYAAGISRAAYYGDPNRVVEESAAKRYLAYIGIRKKRVPLQHITGEQEFMGYPFYVNEHVLIPRQDTEVLVEETLKIIRAGMTGVRAKCGSKEICEGAQTGRETERKACDVRVLDMCTGSGCILLSLIKLCPEVNGTGCDISKEALEIAEKNARRLGVNARWVQSDLFEQLSVPGRLDEGCTAKEEASEGYDIIVSNPPYIRTADIGKLQDEVRIYDPRIALDGREDGLYFYRRIIEDSVSYIRDGGTLLFEIGCDQGKDVTELMKNHGYDNIAVKKDLSGLDRVVAGVYNKGCVCGSGFL